MLGIHPLELLCLAWLSHSQGHSSQWLRNVHCTVAHVASMSFGSDFAVALQESIQTERMLFGCTALNQESVSDSGHSLAIFNSRVPLLLLVSSAVTAHC